MLQRQAISCLPAMIDRVPELVEQRGIDLAFDEASDVDSDEMSAHFDASRLAGTIRRPRLDTKFERFVEALELLLAEGTDRVLVFSFFVRTIESLAERLAERTVGGHRLRVLKLYGPMDRTQRQEAVKAFQDAAGPTVLLSSEVGSEGLDFQFCSAMVNYDLPWNPMRVEQRIGRLDRYGQDTKVIHVLNMVVNDTIEDRIFHRLYERIGIFERSIGDLEAILGEEQHALESLQREVLTRQLTRAEEEIRVRQVADVIVRRQKEDDEFDDDSRRIVGMDDVFIDRFSDIEASRRYVTPEEIQRLVTRWLEGRTPRGTLRGGSGGTFELRVASGDDRFGPDLVAGGTEAPDERRALLAFLARATGTESLTVTFDAAVAMRDATLEFISLHHPLVRGIAGHAERGVPLMSAGILGVPRDQLDALSLFFAFELRERALRDRLEHVNVVVRVGGEVDVATMQQLPELIAQARAPSSDIEVLAESAINDAYRIATTWLDAEVLRREQGLRRVTAESVDARIASLDLSHDRFERHVRRLAQEATDERIRRLRQGQLRNRQVEHEGRRRDLERRREVTIGAALLAAGLLVPD